MRSALALLTLSLVAAPAMAADPAAGKASFAVCGACHSVVAGQNKVGPSLAGVVGRPIGKQAGYSYSPALANAKGSWNPATLSTFLAGPAKAYPGTKMPFAVADAKTRDNVIAYLTTLK